MTNLTEPLPRCHLRSVEFHFAGVMLLDNMQKVSPSPIARLRRLSARRRWLLVRAAVTVSAASAAVAFLPFRRAIRFGSASICQRGLLGPLDCVWAVEAAAKRLPWRAMCIEQGLAAQFMLRRAGFDARLHYGARHEPGTGKLQAHVWVTVGNEAVIGGDEAIDFKEIATFP